MGITLLYRFNCYQKAHFCFKTRHFFKKQILPEAIICIKIRNDWFSRFSFAVILNQIHTGGHSLLRHLWYVKNVPLKNCENNFVHMKRRAIHTPNQQR